MKKLITLFALCLLVMGCQSPSEETVVDETIPSTDYAPEIDELLKGISEIESDAFIVSGISGLPDDPIYGFTYGTENAVDQDFSTAWCPTDEFMTQEWSIQFEETVLPGTVGIQNGFARSEEIFFENNRVKSAYLYYDGDDFITTLEFADTYDMQFFDLPEVPLRELTIEIIDVYPGSKYDDTCISEIDFWSDYVQEKDAEAAYAYYRNNKIQDAIFPASTSTLKIIDAEALTSCGALDTSIYGMEIQSDGEFYQEIREDDGYQSVFAKNRDYDGSYYWWLEAGLRAAVSMQMGSEFNTQDEFTIRWSHASLNLETENYNEWSVLDESVKSPQTCEDDSLYLSMPRPDAELLGPFVRYKVEILHNGDVIDSTSFNFVQ